jgi:hypothetical protein
MSEHYDERVEEREAPVPESPEEYPEEVREELGQHEISHDGKARAGGDEEMSDHMGAVETEPTPVTPPMSGPSKVTEGSMEDAGIEPEEELHGG